MRHVATYAAAFLVYLVLGGSLGGETLVAAAVAGVVAVIAAVAIRRVAARPISFSPADAAALLRAIGRLPADTLRVGSVLLRVAATGGVGGRGTVAPFRFGEIDDAGQRGRRATAVVAGSLTPDTIVLHVAPGRDAICHRLLATPMPDRPERLV